VLFLRRDDGSKRFKLIEKDDDLK